VKAVHDVRGVTVTALLASRAVIAAMVLLTASLLLRGGTLASAAQDLVRWDAASYMTIAAHGYPATASPLDAFLPGLPILIRAVSFIVRDDIAAALLVTLAAEAAALWLVWRLVRAERDASAASFCVLLLAFAPTAIFLSAPFTEAPFIAATGASLFFARQRRPLAACVAGALATSFRLTGLALLPALAVEMLSQSRWRPRDDLFLLVLVPLPIVLYCAYMGSHTGDLLALFHAEASPSFGQSPSWPWSGFATSWGTMIGATDGETRSIFAREVAFGLLGLVACAGMWASRRIPTSFAVYCSVAWLMTASLSFWRSQPRYILALFPALILLADLTARRRAARPALIAGSGVLMCLGTIIFTEGRWLG
jgi:hypothetical protein